MPFFIRNVESLVSGVIIHGVAMDSPTVLHFGSLDSEAIPDKERPIYFRYRDTNPKMIEINFFGIHSTEPTTEIMFNDCRSHFDLLLKAKK
jgi:hypothetical protein